jgi:two-component sensor histidine kinase
MHHIVNECLNITEDGLAFLKNIEQQMRLVADLSRADILMYGLKSRAEVAIVSHAQPHSLAHVYSRSREGRIVSFSHRPEVPQVFTSGKAQKEHRSYIAEGAPVVRQAFPIFYPPRCAWPQQNGAAQPSKVIAVLVIVTNLIEHERHRLRSKVYRRALKKLQAMLLVGKIIGVDALTPFGEQDGIIYTNNEGIIEYASGVAANLYRRVGYREALIGRHLANLDTGDDALRREALAQQRCLQIEAEEADRYWIRKAIPLAAYPPLQRSWLASLFGRDEPQKSGVLILLHDETESRQQDKEIRVKNAMIQEVHHRVKNNLQIIAGLLRMQSRRVKSDEARLALDEALKRILSVAVIHEFLSSNSSNIINIKDISHRIINQFQQGILDPDRHIRLELSGDSIHLPARQATACALIINELLQNAIEHGFEHKREGFVRVNLEDTGDEVIITIADNGDGLSDDFKWEQADSLGLHIVKILVEDDLKGHIQLSKGVDGEEGLSIHIIFSKNIFRGEQGWNEHVSL